MIRCFVILAAVIPVFAFGAQAVQTGYGSAEVDSLLRHGIDLTLRHEYDAARNVFRSMNQKYADDPTGLVFEAGVLQTMSMDYEEFLPGNEFDSLISLAKEKAESAIEHYRNSGWPHLLLGTALGSEAFTRAQRGDWFAAATLGLSSASSFETALELDSTLVDALTGVGTYYYWKTRRIQFLTWLPFVPDRREEGIALLRRGMEEGVYNRFAAMSSLVGIYNDSEEYENSVVIANLALAKYPGNRIFLWGLATALERGQRPQEALAAYRRLLSAIIYDERSNRYNELVCRLKVLSLLLDDKKRDEARVALLEILPLIEDPFPEHLAERAHLTIGKIKALEKELLGKGKP
jgi:tetratricopeptide (TPR) repeat protein